MKVPQEQKAEYENKLKAKLGSHEKGTTENYTSNGSPIQVLVLIANDSKQTILIYIKNM